MLLTQLRHRLLNEIVVLIIIVHLDRLYSFHVSINQLVFLGKAVDEAFRTDSCLGSLLIVPLYYVGRLVRAF